MKIGKIELNHIILIQLHLLILFVNYLLFHIKKEINMVLKIY